MYEDRIVVRGGVVGCEMELGIVVVTGWRLVA